MIKIQVNRPQSTSKAILNRNNTNKFSNRKVGAEIQIASTEVLARPLSKKHSRNVDVTSLLNYCKLHNIKPIDIPKEKLNDFIVK